jgi:heme oxygenase (biliverdin-IX-beta and delta-forming)
MDAPHGLHLHLKLTTAAAHSALEHLLATRGYFDSREGYVDYLNRFLAFQSEAERLLDEALATQVIPDWKERRRSHLARADLRMLGAEEGSFPPSSGLLPELAGPEQILGIAYVLEGSTLGGAFLLRQLAPLGITATEGGSHLASYGAERSQMWRRFISTLEEANARRFCADSVASAALAAFAAARYYLTEAEAGVGTARARAMVSRTASIHT